jgi:hypothetical protein
MPGMLAGSGLCGALGRTVRRSSWHAAAIQIRAPRGAAVARVVTRLVLIVLLTVPAASRLAVAAPERSQDLSTPSFRIDATIPGDEGVVRGRVVDARTGLPVPDAEVRLMPNPRRHGIDGTIVLPLRPPPAAEAAGLPRARTDSRGRYELARVPPDLYGAEVVAPGYLTGYFGYSQSSRLAIPSARTSSSAAPT